MGRAGREDRDVDLPGRTPRVTLSHSTAHNLGKAVPSNRPATQASLIGLNALSGDYVNLQIRGTAQITQIRCNSCDPAGRIGALIFGFPNGFEAHKFQAKFRICRT